MNSWAAIRLGAVLLALAFLTGGAGGQGIDSAALNGLQARRIGPPGLATDSLVVRSLDVDMEIPFRVYAALDGPGAWAGPSGSWRTDGIRAGDWIRLAGGAATGVLADPDAPRYAYALGRSGETTRYDRRTGERKGIRPWAPEGVRLRFGVEPPMARDPFRPELIYVGSRFVHRTGDRGATWQIVSGELAGDGTDSASAISAVVPSPVQEEVIWVGTGDGRIHVTRSSGGTWTEVTSALPDGVPDGASVTGVLASRHHGGTAFVALGGAGGGLYRTGDYGQSWERLGDGGGLEGTVYVVEQDPRARDLLVAGTSRGLHVSFDRGVRWHRWPAGLPEGAVRALRIHPRDYDLVVGVDGSGLYVVDDVRPLRAVAREPGVTARGVHLFEPPPAFVHHLRAGRAPASDGAGAGPELRGRPDGALLTYHVAPDAAGDSVLLEVVDGEGRTVRSLSGPGSVGFHRLVWELDVRVPGGGSSAMPPDVDIRSPRALPGRYTLQLRGIGDPAPERTLRVLPDPRSSLTLEERMAGRDALREAIRLTAVPRQAREALDRVDAEAAAVVEALSGRSGSEVDSVRARSRRLMERAGELRDQARSATRNGHLLAALAGSFGPPTESQRIELLELEESMDALADRVNDFLLGRISLYNDRLRAIGLEPLPDFREIGRPAGS